MAQLPAGSTLEKTNSVLSQIKDYFLGAERENVESIMLVSGFSFAGSGQNAGMGFVKLKNWDERKRADQHADEIQVRSYMPLMPCKTLSFL